MPLKFMFHFLDPYKFLKLPGSAEIKVSTQDTQTETEQLMDSISVAEKEIQILQDTQAEIVKVRSRSNICSDT